LAALRAQAQQNLKENRAGSGARTNLAAQHVPADAALASGRAAASGWLASTAVPAQRPNAAQEILRRIRCRHDDGETHEIFTNTRAFDHCDGVSSFRTDAAAGNCATGD